jgi:hypothetical protein
MRRQYRARANAAARPRKWTDERVEADLRRFIGDRSEWPSYAEFVVHGQRSLREAITRTGGARKWADR